MQGREYQRGKTGGQPQEWKARGPAEKTESEGKVSVTWGSMKRKWKRERAPVSPNLWRGVFWAAVWQVAAWGVWEFVLRHSSYWRR